MPAHKDPAKTYRTIKQDFKTDVEILYMYDFTEQEIIRSVTDIIREVYKEK